MEVIIGALILATIGFGGFKVMETANGITMRHDVTFYTPAFYSGIVGGALTFFAVMLIAGGEALNGFALIAIGCGSIYWGHTYNLRLIPDKDDALKLTAIQVAAGILVFAIVVIIETLKARR